MLANLVELQEVQNVVASLRRQLRFWKRYLIFGAIHAMLQSWGLGCVFMIIDGHDDLAILA